MIGVWLAAVGEHDCLSVMASILLILVHTLLRINRYYPSLPAIFLLHLILTPKWPSFNNPSSTFSHLCLSAHLSVCLLPYFTPNGAISPYLGHWSGSSHKVPLAAVECISMAWQWAPGDGPEDTSAMTLMHWLSTQCSTPTGPPGVWTHVETWMHKSNLQTDKHVHP